MRQLSAPNTFADPSFEMEEGFSFFGFPNAILDALRQGLESVALKLAVAFGHRNEITLTSLVFFARHPKRGGRKILKGEPGFDNLSREWLDIRDRLVRPALQQPAPQIPTTPTPTNAKPLRWGVPGGVISSPFYKMRDTGPHAGMDVTGAVAGKAPGTLHDLRRGLPVYATIKPEIPIADLNNARVLWGKARAHPSGGLGIDGRGTAKLHNALVLVQPWKTKKPENVINQWGGILGLACRYRYQQASGATGTFTLYLEYLHLITRDYPPIDKRGNKFVSPEQWLALGKNLGFGPRMQNRRVFTAAELTRGAPLLVGYLGATAGPHVHINANYEPGEKGYKLYPRFDPTVMIY